MTKSLRFLAPTSRLGSQEYTFPGYPRSRNWISASREAIQTLPVAEATSHSALFTGMEAWITGFQNAGHLMGSWMGRQGQGAQAWTTYWFSPRNKLQFGFRHQKVSHEFIPNGGTLADANVRAEFWPRSSFSLSASVQYEMWNFPVIASTKQSNVTSAVQFSFWPKGFSRKPSN